MVPPAPPKAYNIEDIPSNNQRYVFLCDPFVVVPVAIVPDRNPDDLGRRLVVVLSKLMVGDKLVARGREFMWDPKRMYESYEGAQRAYEAANARMAAYSTTTAPATFGFAAPPVPATGVGGSGGTTTMATSSSPAGGAAAKAIYIFEADGRVFPVTLDGGNTDNGFDATFLEHYEFQGQQKHITCSVFMSQELAIEGWKGWKASQPSAGHS